MARLMRSYCIYFYREAGLAKLLAQAQSSHRPASEALAVKKMHILTEPERSAAVARYQEMLQVAVVATEFDVSRETVRRILRDNNIKTVRKPTFTASQLAEIQARYIAGESTVQLGKKYEVAASTIGDALRGVGIVLRRPVANRW